MSLALHALDASREADFRALHSDACGAGWCQCVAWYLDSWEGFDDRGAEENLALRRELFARGEHDGYLGYVDGAPVLWVQAVPRDRLARLGRDFELAPDPGAWALSCFLVHPEQRGQGIARRAVPLLVEALRARGATSIEAYPRPAGEHDALELWNGPRGIFAAAGFEAVKEAGSRVVMRLVL